MFDGMRTKQAVSDRLRACSVLGMVAKIDVRRDKGRVGNAWLAVVLIKPGYKPDRVAAAMGAPRFRELLVEGSYVSAIIDR